MTEEKYSMLFYMTPQGSMSKIPIIAKIPENQFNEIEEQIASLRRDLKEAIKSRRKLKHEPEIRNNAAKCDECDLCMVCAGNHRKYESWPPGTGQCFAFMLKKGKPIRDVPCSFCDHHDLELRNFKRFNAQGLSKESTLKNRLNKLIAKRKQLYLDYQIKVEVISE